MVDQDDVRFADAPTVEVQTLVDAPPEALWPLVVEPSALPPLSDELDGVGWLDGVTAAAAGARFEGRNSSERFGAWVTTSTVVGYEPPWRFAWAVGDPEAPLATWWFTLARTDGGGTLLSQAVRLGPGPSGVTAAIDAMPDKEVQIVRSRMRRHEAAMAATLQGLKARAEAAPAPPGEAGGAGGAGGSPRPT